MRSAEIANSTLAIVALRLATLLATTLTLRRPGAHARLSILPFGSVGKTSRM